MQSNQRRHGLLCLYTDTGFSLSPQRHRVTHSHAQADATDPPQSASMTRTCGPQRSIQPPSTWPWAAVLPGYLLATLPAPGSASSLSPGKVNAVPVSHFKGIFFSFCKKRHFELGLFFFFKWKNSFSCRKRMFWILTFVLNKVSFLVLCHLREDKMLIADEALYDLFICVSFVSHELALLLN